RGVDVESIFVFLDGALALEGGLRDGDEIAEVVPAEPGGPDLHVQLGTTAALHEANPDLVGPLRQPGAPLPRLRSVYAVVVHDELAVDVQPRAVIAGDEEGIMGLALDFEKGVELQSEVVVTARDADVEADGRPRGVRRQLAEIGYAVPASLVVGIVRRPLAGRQIDAGTLKEIVGNVVSLLAGEQLWHAARRAHVLRVLQERGQAGDRI